MAATRQPAAVRVSDTGTSRTVVVDPRVVEMCSLVWASSRTPEALEFSTDEAGDAGGGDESLGSEFRARGRLR